MTIRKAATDHTSAADRASKCVICGVAGTVCDTRDAVSDGVILLIDSTGDPLCLECTAEQEQEMGR